MFPPDDRPEPMALTHGLGPPLMPTPPTSPCDCGKYNLKCEPLEIESGRVHTAPRCGRFERVTLERSGTFNVEWLFG